MEANDIREPSPRQTLTTSHAAAIREGDVVIPSSGNAGSCPTCTAGSMPRSFVYALGRIEARFPSASVEKEFAQAIGRAETAGQTDQQAFVTALAKRESRYLTRNLCWVMTIQGLETYLLQPRDPSDYDRLIEAIRPQPSPMDVDVVVGMRGRIAPPDLCNGLTLPIVAFDQIYSFDRESLIKAIPKPDKLTAKQFAPAAEELFSRIMQMTDNAGATDEHRALNYLAMRYPAVYTIAADQFGKDYTLTASSRGRRPSAARATSSRSSSPSQTATPTSSRSSWCASTCPRSFRSWSRSCRPTSIAKQHWR